MSTDLERLVVSLEANVKKYVNALERTTRDTQRRLGAIERAASDMEKRTNASFDAAAAGLRKLVVGLGAGLGAREVKLLADDWTRAGNLIAAAGQVAGRAGRDLEGINRIARDTRAGFGPTSELYARLLRSTAGVAESEEQVARATEIVNKAFKAGGAAASEMAAGVLQLSQGLGSGVLQGDELRSVRENAPLLAQAIADYFGVTVAGLKQLGEEGQLTSDKVFQAILAAQPQVEKAFAATNMTIEDGLTQIWNSLTQYVGQTDRALGASQRLTAGLGALADNFETIADAVLMIGTALGIGLAVRMAGASKAAAVLTAEVARQRIALTLAAQVAGGYGSLLTAVASRASAAAIAMRGFSMASAALGGPVGIALTGLALAFVYAGQKTQEASEYADLYAAALDKVRGKAREAGDEARAAADTFVHTEARRVEKHLATAAADLDRARDELVRALEGQIVPDFLARIIGPGEEANRIFRDLLDKFRRGEIDAQGLREELSRIARLGFPDLIENFDELLAKVQASSALVSDLRERLEGLNDIRVSVPDVPDLGATFGDLQKAGFSARQIAESKKSTDQKRLEAEAQKLLNEARKEGIPLQEAEALALARVTLANEKAIKAGEKTNQKKSPQEKFETELRRVQERIRYLDLERQTLGMTTAEREEARAALELQIAAERAGAGVYQANAKAIEEYAQRIGEAEGALERARQAQESFVELQQFIGQELSSFFSDVVSGGENAEKALMNLVKRLADVALQAALLGQGPLAGLLGTTGTGGIVGSLFKGLSPGSLFAGIYHSGGVVGAGGARRSVPASAFAGAPRYHTGGIAGLRPGEVPAVLQRGELVLNKAQQAAMGRGGGGESLKVIIQEAPGTEATASMTNGPDGKALEVMIRNVVLGDVAKGGDISRGLQSRFGLNSMRGR